MKSSKASSASQTPQTPPQSSQQNVASRPSAELPRDETLPSPPNRLPAGTTQELPPRGSPKLPTSSSRRQSIEASHDLLSSEAKDVKPAQKAAASDELFKGVELDDPGVQRSLLQREGVSEREVPAVDKELRAHKGESSKEAKDIDPEPFARRSSDLESGKASKASKKKTDAKGSMDIERMSETSRNSRADPLGLKKLGSSEPSARERLLRSSRLPQPKTHAPGSAEDRIAKARVLLATRFATDEVYEAARKSVPQLAAAHNKLDRWFGDMTVDPSQDQATQRELKDLYIKEHAPIDAAWSILFGRRYSLGRPSTAPVHEGSINAVFEGARGGVSSAMRNPGRNGVAVQFAPRPGSSLTTTDVHIVDANAGGGIMGGLGTYTFEKAVDKAMTRQAAKRNLPKMVEVPADLLAFERSRIRQHNWIGEDGNRVVRFYIAGTQAEEALFTEGLQRAPQGVLEKLSHLVGLFKEDMPDWHELDLKATDNRSEATVKQAAYEADHLLALLQPLLTSSLGSTEPLILDPTAQQNALSVFAVSTVLSGTAGGLRAGTLNLFKGLPSAGAAFDGVPVLKHLPETIWPHGQIKVENAVGDEQWVNLYIPDGRSGNPEEPMARWADAVQFKGRQPWDVGPARVVAAVSETVLESAGRFALLIPQTLTSASRALDLFARNVLPNVVVSVVAPASAGAVLEPFSNSLSRPVNENPASLIGRTRIALPKGLNDLMWPPLRRLMDRLTEKTEATRAQRRSMKEAAITNAGGRERLDELLTERRGTLPGLVEAAIEALPPRDHALMNRVAAAASGEGGMSVNQLKALSTRLAPQAASVDAVRKLQRTVKEMVVLMSQRQRMAKIVTPSLWERAKIAAHWEPPRRDRTADDA